MNENEANEIAGLRRSLKRSIAKQNKLMKSVAAGFLGIYALHFAALRLNRLYSDVASIQSLSAPAWAFTGIGIGILGTATSTGDEGLRVPAYISLGAGAVWLMICYIRAKKMDPMIAEVQKDVERQLDAAKLALEVLGETAELGASKQDKDSGKA